MSFFETQKDILTECLYGTSVVVLPGTGILTGNLKTTVSLSAGYLVSCIAKGEVNSYFRGEKNSQEINFAIDVISGIVGGIAYTGTTGYPIVESSVMSIGYTMSYTYVSNSLLSLCVVAVETITNQLENNPNLKTGIYSGVVFASLDIIERMDSGYNMSFSEFLDTLMVEAFTMGDYHPMT